MRIKHYVTVAVTGLALVGGVTGCSLDNLLNGDDAAGGKVIDPRAMRSYSGALTLYHSSISKLMTGIKNAGEEVAAFTDEMSNNSGTSGPFDQRLPSRSLNQTGLFSQAYAPLQTARVLAAQSIELFKVHGTTASYPLIGDAYAIQGHAVLLLAELFCSGIPLTDVPFEGQFKYSRALSTQELLEQAIALFDSAYAYGKDSLPIATFARVGKGRALLGLGKYTEAAAAVADIPNAGRYVVEFTNRNEGIAFWPYSVTVTGGANEWQVLDREGGNGIRWTADSAAWQDPRVPLSTRQSPNGLQYTTPLQQLKYPFDVPNTTFVVADGIQARLIEAEAQLQPPANPSGPWLTTLNAIRATVGLADTTDPGTELGRVDLLFRERAFWLYLTGQRMGDMRRLIRLYGRPTLLVYPTGVYPRGNLFSPAYGNEKVFMPPVAEEQYNFLYEGCLSTDA